MDTLTLVLLIYFIAVQSIWLATLICHLSTNSNKLIKAMLYVAIAITVPYIGLFIAIEQPRKNKTNEETNEDEVE